MAVKSMQAILLAPNDNVAAAIDAVVAAAPVAVALNSSGETVFDISSRQGIPFGHKIAVKDLAKGSSIIRYGYPIGIATADIKQGDLVHSHNMRSALSPIFSPQKRRQARFVRLSGFVDDVLLAANAHADAADAMAAAMTEAHLRGVETHGLRRLRPYLCVSGREVSTPRRSPQWSSAAP